MLLQPVTTNIADYLLCCAASLRFSPIKRVVITPGVA